MELEAQVRALEAQIAELRIDLSKAVDAVVASCNSELSKLRERLAYLEGKNQVQRG